MQWHYKLRHIGFQQLLQLARWDIIPEHLSTIDVSELKCASCQFENMALQYTRNQKTNVYPQQ